MEPTSGRRQAELEIQTAPDKRGLLHCNRINTITTLDKKSNSLV